NRITAFWFKGKELALAFGVTLAFSRLGSVLNFFLTEKFEDKYGMQWTLWGGALLCVLGFVSAIIVSALDKIGMRQLGLDGAIQEQSRKVKWLIMPMILLMMSVCKLLTWTVCDLYYSDHRSMLHTGLTGQSFLCLGVEGSGCEADFVGLRGVFAVACAVFTLPVFGLLAFTFVPPLVSTIWLGVTYSFAAVSLIQLLIIVNYLYHITDYSSHHGGTLNKTTKRSGQAEGDSEREPLNQRQEEEEQNEANGSNVTSRSVNS
ncbi:hypothetical protein XENOCAPTIV_002593, partial [Xenoophorus captivus]